MWWTGGTGVICSSYEGNCINVPIRDFHLRTQETSKSVCEILALYSGVFWLHDLGFTTFGTYIVELPHIVQYLGSTSPSSIHLCPHLRHIHSGKTSHLRSVLESRYLTFRVSEVSAIPLRGIPPLCQEILFCQQRVFDRREA